MEEIKDEFNLNWLEDLKPGEQFSGGKLEINEEENKSGGKE